MLRRNFRVKLKKKKMKNLINKVIRLGDIVPLLLVHTHREIIASIFSIFRLADFTATSGKSRKIKLDIIAILIA